MSSTPARPRNRAAAPQTPFTALPAGRAAPLAIPQLGLPKQLAAPLAAVLAGLLMPLAAAPQTLSAAVPNASVAANSIGDARSGPDPRLRAILNEAIAEADSFADRFDAEVWLIDMSQRLAPQVDDPAERIAILKTVHRYATQFGLAPELVLAVIDVESNFDRYAISSATALGLMQIMPFWIGELELEDQDMNQLFDVERNILLGCRILKFYVDMENGDLVKGLARYNGSVGQRWYADRVLDRLRDKWFRL